MTKITSPVVGFSGTTHLGALALQFEDGTAEIDDLPDAARAYLLGAGYKVGNKSGEVTSSLDGNAVADIPVVDSRDFDKPIVEGTKLRDAAVDPQPEDFLAPTNAGDADPHGPEVVSPEVHASQGVRPVKGGDVYVDDPADQDSAEKAHAAAATDGTPVELLKEEKAEVVREVPEAPEAPVEVAAVEQPSGNASADVWRDYALTQKGATEDDVKDLGRNALRDKYSAKS